jgi:hypothetical protein
MGGADGDLTEDTGTGGRLPRTCLLSEALQCRFPRTMVPKQFRENGDAVRRGDSESSPNDAEELHGECTIPNSTGFVA